MSLMKKINDEIYHDENLIESVLSDTFFAADGSILQESLSGFLVGAKKLIDELCSSDTVIIPGEQEDRVTRFISLLAGLEYFRQKSVGTDQRCTINTLLDDPQVTDYVYKAGAEKAQEITKTIQSYFFNGKIVKRDELDAMIEDIRKFYIAKKANVGTLLHVPHAAED